MKREETHMMKLDKSLITGNELIDNQHSELIDKIYKLIDCCGQGGGKIETVKMLDYLSDYTDFHFGAEEKLQEDAAYPGLAEHREKHEEFKKAVHELHEMLIEEEGPTDAFVNAVQKNVKEWMFEHIQKVDKAMAAYLQAKA